MSGEPEINDHVSLLVMTRLQQIAEDEARKRGRAMNPKTIMENINGLRILTINDTTGRPLLTASLPYVRIY